MRWRSNISQRLRSAPTKSGIKIKCRVSPFLTVWIEWFAHKFGIQLPVSPSTPFLVCAEMYSSVCVSRCVSHSSRQVGRLTKVKMLYSMRQEKHRNTEYRRRHMKPRRLFNVHLLRCTPRTWTGRRQAEGQRVYSSAAALGRLICDIIKHSQWETQMPAGVQQRRSDLYCWAWSERGHDHNQSIQTTTI